MFAQPSWLGCVQWDRQCSALPLFINRSFCSCKQHEYLIRPKIPSWLMNASQPARQALWGRGPPGTVAKQSSLTYFTLSWTTRAFCTAARIPHACVTRSDPPRLPGGNARRETRTHRDTWLRRRRSWCHFPWMEICCALARFPNRFTTESKGLRAIKGYLLFAPLSLSPVHECHMLLHRRGETERDRQTDRHS